MPMPDMHVEIPPAGTTGDGGEGDVVVIYDELAEEPGDDEHPIGSDPYPVPTAGSGCSRSIPTGRPFLESVVERMNGKPEITVLTEEPSDRPFAVRSTTIGRADPGFVDALFVYLRANYGLRIV